MIKKRGFTLVELLTVIVIIALMSMVTMKLFGYVGYKTGKSRAARDIERIKHALTEYYSVYGCFPPTSGSTWERPQRDPNTGNVIGLLANPDGGLKENEGLCKYLYGDPAAKGKWSHFVEGLQDTDVVGYRGNNAQSGNVSWSNDVTRIADPWGRSYIYTNCLPPEYQSYELYSLGPNAGDPSDDVGKSWSE
jgi:prepilin-type N-terminal cleavage/methylation domain-containing protein